MTTCLWIVGLGLSSWVLQRAHTEYRSQGLQGAKELRNDAVAGTLPEHGVALLSTTGSNNTSSRWSYALAIVLVTTGATSAAFEAGTEQARGGLFA